MITLKVILASIQVVLQNQHKHWRPTSKYSGPSLGQDTWLTDPTLLQRDRARTRHVGACFPLFKNGHI